MKKLVSLFALLLACFMIFTCFVFPVAVSAEGEEDSSSESTPEESTPEESDGEESTPEGPVFTVTVTGNPEGVDVYFNGSEAPASEFSSAEDGNVDVRVVAKEGYELISVSLDGRYDKTVDGGECSFTERFKVSVGSYTIEVVAVPVIEKVSLSVAAVGITGITVNGSEYSSSLEFDKGTEVAVAFGEAESFDASLAVLIVNGSSHSMNDNTYTFTIESNTELVLKYNVSPVTVTLSGGLGSVTICGHTESLEDATGSTAYTCDVTNGETVTFTVAPYANYKVTAVLVDGIAVTESEGVYSAVVSNSTSISVVFASSGGTTVTTNYSLTLSVGAGGVITYNGAPISGTSTKTVAAGSLVTLTVVPDTGYQVKAFRVNGADCALTDNAYIIPSVTGEISVVVTFEEIVVPPVITDEPIKVSDINWSGNQIVVDITNQTEISKEVFDKIASYTNDGVSYITFRGTNIIWMIELGSNVTVSGDSVNLAATKLTSGSYYDEIANSIKNATDAEVTFSVFTVDTGALFPETVKISVQLGEKFVGGHAVMLVYENGTFSSKDNAPDAVLVGTNGWSAYYPYDNEATLFFSKNLGTPQISVTATAGIGGLISPSGVQSIAFGSSASYTITANEGFVIKQLLVDGVAVTDAAGKGQYVYTIGSVESDKIIAVEFVSAAEAGDSSDDGGSNTMVVVIIIVLVIALLGAASLFIVKWRQEKF